MNITYNKAIMSLMGLNPRLVAPDVYSLAKTPDLSVTGPTPPKVIEDFSKSTQYHESWGWLMEVVEKVEALTMSDFIINGCSCKLEFDAHLAVFSKIAVESSKILAVYEMAGMFAVWYKDHKKSLDKEIKDKLAEGQVALIHAMQKSGFSVVTCGECGDVLLQKTDVDELQCPHCLFKDEIGSFPDLFYANWHR